MKRLQFILLIVVNLTAIISYAQHLTISSTGETGTSGTNWSISGNVLQLSSSNVSASIHPSVIENHLFNTGNLAINIPNINGVRRNIIINNAITYTGSVNRTLVIKAQNHININSGGNITSTNAALNLVIRAANASGSLVDGYVNLSGISINTNGGHLWIAGGGVDTQWNGLTVGDHSARTYTDNVSALSIIGCTLSTNGGNIYASGHSFESGSPTGSNNYGLDIDNSTISSLTGNIELIGQLLGRYTTGFGAFIGCRTGNIHISTTSGSISIHGDGYDQNAATNGNGTRHALNIAVNAGRTLNINTVSGNINLSGSANFNNSTIDDAEGLLLSSGNTSKSLNITSQSGNITLSGTNTRSITGQFCNGIRLYALDVANAIYIGDDGVNPYTGNITISTDAFLQRVNNTGAGSIALKTSGSITFQPISTSFTHLRAGNSPGTLSFDNDWDFGTTATAITFGKPGNTFALSLSNAITTNGTITLHSGNQNIGGVLTSNGQILAKSTGNIVVSGNLISNAGNIILWADSDNNNAGGININDNVTIDSRTAADRTANTHTTGGGKITLAGGLDDGGTAAGTAALTSGLIANDNIPDGYAVNSGSSAAQSGIAIGTASSPSGHNANVNIFSGSGDILVMGLATTTINGGGPDGLLFFQGHNFNAGTNGNITLVGNSNSGTYGMGMDLAAWRNTSYSATSSMTTVNGNINLIGRSSNSSNGNWGILIDGEGNNRHVFRTTTGSVTFNALATGTTAQLDTRLTNVDILSNSGNINLISLGAATGLSVGSFNIGNGIFLGQKAGSAVTSSSSAITISANKIDLLNKPLAIASSGNIVVEPYSSSFVASPVWSSANFTVDPVATNIRIGKDGNTSNVTIPSALSANGPISIYGAQITLNNSLTTTNASTGDILLKGTTLLGSGSINLANGRAVTINMSTNSTCSSPINGTGVSLIKEGAGELTLSGASNFNGNTTINTGFVQLNENKTFNGITVAAGATLALGPNKQFDFTSSLVNNGTIILRSGATLLNGSSNTISGSGSYVVEQAITGTNSGGTPNGRFWYLGSPVVGAFSTAYNAGGPNVLKFRNESANQWTEITTDGVALNVGQGYYCQVAANSTLSFAGSALNNGAISISGLTRTAGQGFEGFNLVSNPYPSYLDWDAVTKTNVGNTMWYRTASGSTAASMVFETYVAGAAGGIGTNLSGNVATKWIPPMQSFWVRVAQGQTTGSIAVDNTMRAHFTSVSGSTAGLRSTNDELKLFLRMNLLQADKKDQLIVYVNGNATNGFDQLDGEKMMQAGMPQFYTSAAGKKITINGLNSAKKQQSLPVTMELPTTGVHSFVIEDLEISNGLVWLEDKQEESMQVLEPGTVYEFYANSGINAERFVLHFQLIDDATPVNVYNEVNSSANFSGKGASVHAESAGVVVIKLPATTEGITDIQIRDAAGKLVYTGSTNTLETSVQLEQANGIYYVTLNSTSGVEVRKVFIQQ